MLSPEYVEFIDVQRGYLFARPEVYFTDDGGSSWEERARVPGIPYDASFVSPDRGWVTTHEGLYETADAGRTWVRRYRPEVPFVTVEFVSPADGFAADLQGRYLKTVDGGKTWTDGGSPCRDDWDNVFDFVSAEQGLLLCSERTSSDYSEKWLYRTADGHTWSPVSIADLAAGNDPQAPAVPQTFPPVYRVGRLSTPDGVTVVIDGDGGLFRSDDGGISWLQLVEAGVSESYANALVMVDPQTGYLLAPTLQRTTDGGETWASAGQPDAPARHYDFVTGDVGFGIGRPTRPGAVLRTDDGGGSWSVVGETLHPQAMDFADTGHGWTATIEGDAYVIRASTDGGVSWSEVTRIASGNPGYDLDMSFVDDAKGYLLDTNGRLWRTGDGGRTFEEVHSRTSLEGAAASEYAFDFVSADVGFVLVGGELLATRDGGGTWARAAALNLESMNFVDKDTGWASGPGDGAVDLTRDGGQTWARYRTPGVQPQWVFAIDGTNASFIDAQGCLFRTVDGGASWTGVRCLRGS